MKRTSTLRMIGAAFACLMAAPSVAQTAQYGGVDVQLRMDDVVESYWSSKTSLAFMVRDISFGYQMSGTGRGALGSQKFSVDRQDVDQPITPGKEPRGIIIEKGAGDQPTLRIRMSGKKGDVLVKGKFIRSDWNMLTEGRTITIIAPVEDMQVLRSILDQIRAPITKEVSNQLTSLPKPGLEMLELRTMRTDGDQVIIQGNKMGFTISYPSATATYSAELKAAP
ncbi:hypothetical protein [Emcibacter sp. SYSU 3D8]|uniref:hypothetical protein n=1 Tax=Emcibacter sp. SYSU 3D8 TaxID=3133969 RepID=UPI0031FE70FB